MAIVICNRYCLVFISRSSDLIQYGGIVTKVNKLPSLPDAKQAITRSSLYRILKNVASNRSNQVS